MDFVSAILRAITFSSFILASTLLTSAQGLVPPPSAPAAPTSYAECEAFRLESRRWKENAQRSYNICHETYVVGKRTYDVRTECSPVGWPAACKTQRETLDCGSKTLNQRYTTCRNSVRAFLEGEEPEPEEQESRISTGVGSTSSGLSVAGDQPQIQGKEEPVIDESYRNLAKGLRVENDFAEIAKRVEEVTRDGKTAIELAFRNAKREREGTVDNMTAALKRISRDYSKTIPKPSGIVVMEAHEHASTETEETLEVRPTPKKPPVVKKAETSCANPHGGKRVPAGQFVCLARDYDLHACRCQGGKCFLQAHGSTGRGSCPLPGYVYR